jgi:amino acid permease
LEYVEISQNLFPPVHSFFVTIASVLGTGILGLPVKTANSGFFPFLVIFLIVLIFEVPHTSQSFLFIYYSKQK